MFDKCIYGLEIHPSGTIFVIDNVSSNDIEELSVYCKCVNYSGNFLNIYVDSKDKEKVYEYIDHSSLAYKVYDNMSQLTVFGAGFSGDMSFIISVCKIIEEQGGGCYYISMSDIGVSFIFDTELLYSVKKKVYDIITFEF